MPRWGSVPESGANTDTGGQLSVLVAENVDDGRYSLDGYASANYGLPLHELERFRPWLPAPGTMWCLT